MSFGMRARFLSHSGIPAVSYAGAVTHDQRCFVPQRKYRIISRKSFSTIRKNLMKNEKYLRIALVLIFVGLVLPAVVTGLFLFFTPSVSPEEAAQLLRDSKGDAILIDVRPEEEFHAFSLQESINVPLDAPSFDRSFREKLLGGKKHILVICDTGISGALATHKLRRMSFLNAVNIQGGLDAWLTGNGELLKKRVRTSYRETQGVSPVTFSITE